MHASTWVERGLPETPSSDGAACGGADFTRLTSFVLIHDRAAHPRQAECLDENPFCRLAERTAQGAQICNRGCGMSHPAAQREHVCPFGLAMRRAEDSGPVAGPGAALGAASALPSSARWIGRRFASVGALHEALDRLIDEGFDEETVLNHLPPNPVVSREELQMAIAAQKVVPIESEEPAAFAPQAPVAPVVPAAPAVRAALRAAYEIPSRPAATVVPAAEEARENFSSHVMEYLEQIQALVAGAARPDLACERFLRAVAAVLPCESTAIYLADPSSAGLVLASALEAAPAAAAAPQPRPCRLSKGEVGWEAFDLGEARLSHGGRIEPWRGTGVGPGVLAVPLPISGGERRGVWILQTSSPLPAVRLGCEPAAMVRFLAEMLGLRLRLSASASGAGAAPEEAQLPCPTWSEAALATELRPELARAARLGACTALLRLQLATSAKSAPPGEELSAALRKGLRPYDRLGQPEGFRHAWDVIAALPRPEAARALAERLAGIVEDAADARGGLEEQGLRLAVGVSVWGSDAAGAEQMIDHAARAADHAAAQAGDDPICLFDEATIPTADARGDAEPGRARGRKNGHARGNGHAIGVAAAARAMQA